MYILKTAVEPGDPALYCLDGEGSDWHEDLLSAHIFFSKEEAMTAKSKSEWDGCKIQVKKMSLSEIRDRWTFEQRSLQALEKKYHDLVSGITSALHKVDA